MPTPPKAPRVKTGVTKLDAAFAAWSDAIDRALRVSVAGGLSQRWTPAGWVIVGPADRRMTVRLDSSNGDGSYDAVQAQAEAGGTWSDVTGGWAGVAWEFNLNADLDLSADYIVEAEYVPDVDEWRFQAGSCDP